MTDPTIGDNNPPPSAAHAATMRELAIEAESWLTGADIRDDDAASKLTAFLDRVIEAERSAKAAKEAEYRPVKAMLDGITAAWKPVLDEATRIRDVARPVLTKWQRHKDELARQVAEQARLEAEAKRKAAEEAMRASAGDLEARRAAEELTEKAKTHEIAARAIAKQPTRLKVGGRSIQMRKRYDAVVVDGEPSADRVIAYLWQDFERVWREVLEPQAKAMAIEETKARNPSPGQYTLAGGAIVVTVTEDAV